MISLNSKALLEKLLESRAGKFSPLKKIFAPHLEFLLEESGLSPDGEISEITYNIQHDIYGRGKCEICPNPTRLYPQRGGWAKYCSKKCMNDKASSRHLHSEETKQERGTGIGHSQTRSKMESTMINLYGTTNASNVPELVAKREKTFIERFGENTPWKNQEVQLKCKDTMTTLYGGTGFGSSIIHKKIIGTRRSRIFDSLQVKFSTEWKILTLVKDWTGSHSTPLKLEHKCNTIVDKWLWYGQNLFEPKCPKCHKSSIPQFKLIEMIESSGINNLSVNNRNIIAPNELDIVIREKALAFEVNGLFYHGEKSPYENGIGKDRKYHLNKTEKALKAGYQLIQFTDLEIFKKPSAVKHLILSKLGKLEKIYARNTECKSITSKVANDFLNLYHMQGSCKANINLGLFYKNNLIAVMTFGNSRYDTKSKNKSKYELLRFTSSFQIIGGASKLLAQFRNNYSGQIVSFADRRWSQGDMYFKLGFELVKHTKPGYWYYKGKEFHHRTKFQKHKIKHLAQDVSDTEWDIMQQQGWNRIWDCGSMKFILRG